MEQYKWLPRFTHNTIVYRKKFDPPHQKALQYIAVGSIIFIGMGIAGFFLANVYIGTYAYFVTLPVLILIVGYWFLLRKLSGRFEDIFNNKNKQSI